jgi:hypothetical protein
MENRYLHGKIQGNMNLRKNKADVNRQQGKPLCC